MARGARVGVWLFAGAVVSLASCDDPPVEKVEPPPKVEAPPPPEPPAPKPEVEPAPEPVPEPEPVDPTLTDTFNGFPVWARVSVPDGRSTPVPVGQKVLDVTVHPSGAWALVVTKDTDRDNVQWHRWDFGSPLTDLPGPALDTALAYAAVFDPLDASLVVAARVGEGHALLRCPSVRATDCTTLLETNGRLADLRIPLARWGGGSRVFASLDEDGFQRVVSVRTTGEHAYDVTHPTGALSALTSDTLRQRVGADVWDDQPPRVFRSRSARLLDIDPASGDALFTQDGTVLRIPWDWNEQNWQAMAIEEPGLTMQTGGEIRVSPNGRMRWMSAENWVQIVDRDGSLWAKKELTDHPALLALVPTGDCGVFGTDTLLSTECVDHPAARTRFLDRAPNADLNALFDTGLAYETPSADRLYETYEHFQYRFHPPPVFASVDGMLTVLHAAMQAVFLQRETQESAPALKAFLQTLATKAPEPRVVNVAKVGLHLLDQGVATPSTDPTVEAELARIRAGTDARSDVYGTDLQYDDYKPRGPYTTDDALKRYFQAFKATNNLVLTDDEHAELGAIPEVVDTWSRWQSVQAPFLMGSRQGPLFADAALPAYVNAPCTKPGKRRMFALSWGPDSEVLERLVAHDQLPPECGVQYRQHPSGLDLLAAFGDRDARALLLTSPEGRFEGYIDALDRVSARDLKAPGVSGAWLAMVDAIVASTDVPRDVKRSVWHRRRMETALSTWVDLRHLLVLVTERGGAQAGDGGEGWFEQLQVEPSYSAVDPMPLAWKQLAEAADQLAALVRPDDDRALHDLLTKLPATAREFEAMARTQMAGKPLTADQYGTLAWYIRSVEWPLMELSRYSAPADLRTRVPQPPPDARIVDILAVSPPGEPRRYFHIAKGQPRPLTVLLTDRGVTVPAQGAVSSYFEVVSPDILDDADWTDRLSTAERPHWLNPDPVTPER